jgi:glycosyltransferase involved in cell wall biosynthesis
MRILIAHEALTGAGGIESYLAGMIPALLARGHRLGFLYLTPCNETGPVALGHPDVPSIGVDDEGLDGCIAWVRDFRPDVCFSHNIRQLAVDDRLVNEWPTVKMMHGYFGACISSQKAHAFPSLTPCTRTFGPACLALYLPRYCGQLRPAKMVRHYRWARTQNDLLSRYSALVVASGHMADEFARHGVDAARIITAPLFPTASSALRPRPLPSRPTVVFAGRMTPLKGGDVLIRAVATAARRLGLPLHLRMAGDGPESGRWRALADRLQVDASFDGWVTGDRRIEIFRSATVSVTPSVWPEPFGLAGLDAAAHGVPSIAFDVGGIREWLRDGLSGRLVREVGNAEALGVMLSDLLANPDEIERLSAGAFAQARALSVEAHVAIVERALESCAAARVRPS